MIWQIQNTGQPRAMSFLHERKLTISDIGLAGQPLLNGNLPEDKLDNDYVRRNISDLKKIVNEIGFSPSLFTVVQLPYQRCHLLNGTLQPDTAHFPT